MLPFFSLTVEGLDNLPRQRTPLLIITNHKSYYDPLVIANSLPLNFKAYPLRFISKDDFFNSRLSSFLFRSMGAFPSMYGQGIDASLKIPTEILRAGGTVVFFPEGKCIRSDGLGEPKIGAAALAKRVGMVSVLPIAITNSYKIGTIFRRPHVRVKIGGLVGPTVIHNSSAEELMDFFMQKISELYSGIYEEEKIKTPIHNS